jgi:translocation and assembly module TamB
MDRAAAAARWIVRILVGLALLVALAAAGLWWWAGQEGSLDWVLRHLAAGGALRSDGVHGAFRGAWQIDHVAWERDGLRLEADDVRLQWEPLAVLDGTLQLRRLQVARARVIDQRPASLQPLQPPRSLRLPWRVDVQDVEVGQLTYEGRFTLAGSGLAGHYAYDGLHHRARLDALQLAGGDYRGDVSLLAIGRLTLNAALAGRFQAPLPGRNERVPLQFQLRAQGPLAGFDANARLQVLDPAAGASALPQGTATARITPFAAMPVPRGAADVQQVDLAMFWPAAPATSLSGHVEVQPQGGQAWQLQADLRNDRAGPWDRHRLPIARARGEGQWRDGTALVRSIEAEVGGGRIAGAGAWAGAGWRFDGDVQAVDPAQVLATLAPVPLTGGVRLHGEARSVDFDVALKAGAPLARKPGATTLASALELREIAARGRWSGDTLSLPQLHVQTSDAALDGHVDVALAARAGAGELHLRAPGLQAQAKGNVSSGRGQGRAELHASDLAQARRWLARWPDLQHVAGRLDLRGQAQGDVAWQGGWRDPTVQARVGAATLAWQGGAHAWTLRDALLQVQGRLRDAALQLRAHAAQGQRTLDVTGAGRIGGTLGGAWHGQVASLQLQWQDPALTPGPWGLQLRHAVDWRVAGSNLDLGAGEAVLHAPALPSGAPPTDALVSWSPVRKRAGVLTTAGHLDGVPLAWLEFLGSQQLAGAALSGDMVFDGQWNAQLGSSVRVDATLARVRGDIDVLTETVDGTSARLPAGVRTARLTLHGQGDELALALLWDSERAGHAEGEVRTRVARTAAGWQWPEAAPISGHVRAELPRIGVWSVLAPPGWRLRGSLEADIAIAGTRGQPRLSGPLKADDLALRSVVDGVELRNGHLRAQLAGDRLVVSEFVLHGSEQGGGDGGTLTAAGEGRWTPEGPRFEAQAQLVALRASIRSDRQLTVSGNVAARTDAGRTDVTGKLTIDRARIRIPEETPPQLGPDVVVHNVPGVAETDAQRRASPATSSRGSGRISVRIAIDLGPDFRLAGRGVDTRLAGTVQVQGDSLGMPQLVGAIHAVGGSYRAYGEQLAIERGELRFTGPADDPAVDVLAIRPNLTPKVGVQVTGRAQSPHVELYSEAGQSEAETLSYLVLGRSSSGGGTETALLQRAATALLAGRRGNSKGIAGSLGLDDLQVRNDSVTGPVVRVGKRFAQNFYAAYERSLSGAMGTLFIFYDVSKRVTVRAEAGERAGVDLIFTFSFDRIGRRR